MDTCDDPVSSSPVHELDLILWSGVFNSRNLCSAALQLKAIYTADTEKYPVLFSGQKTSCRVLMDFTSAIPADPRGTEHSYTRLGSSRH